MADVRSLLRSEQASRRITHPNLSYTKSGLLNCTVCNLFIKSETLWEGHLRSSNHKKNIQKAQNVAVADINGNASKKRKLEDDGEEERKKTKQEPEDKQAEAGPVEVAQPQEQEEDPPTQEPTPVIPTEPNPPPPEPAPQVDEDEWAAFEREVVPLTHDIPPDYTSATISAAPVTAAELAAQTNAEKQQRRDADLEDEKAEEETRMVEEFEVMEGLEERVRALKEKREKLRLGARADRNAVVVDDKEGEERERPPDPDEEDGSDEVDEWGF